MGFAAGRWEGRHAVGLVEIYDLIIRGGVPALMLAAGGALVGAGRAVRRGSVALVGTGMIAADASPMEVPIARARVGWYAYGATVGWPRARGRVRWP